MDISILEQQIRRSITDDTSVKPRSTNPMLDPIGSYRIRWSDRVLQEPTGSDSRIDRPGKQKKDRTDYATKQTSKVHEKRKIML